MQSDPHGALSFEAIPAATGDTPVLHLDRAMVIAALDSGDTLWYYSTTTGWCALQFFGPPPANSSLTSSEPFG